MIIGPSKWFAINAFTRRIFHGTDIADEIQRACF
jgi:hypothetical protein